MEPLRLVKQRAALNHFFVIYCISPLKEVFRRELGPVAPSAPTGGDRLWDAKKELVQCPTGKVSGSAPGLTGLTHLPLAQWALMSARWRPRSASSRPSAPYMADTSAPVLKARLSRVNTFISDFMAERFLRRAGQRFPQTKKGDTFQGLENACRLCH